MLLKKINIHLDDYLIKKMINQNSTIVVEKYEGDIDGFNEYKIDIIKTVSGNPKIFFNILSNYNSEIKKKEFQLDINISNVFSFVVKDVFNSETLVIFKIDFNRKIFKPNLRRYLTQDDKYVKSLVAYNEFSKEEELVEAMFACSINKNINNDTIEFVKEKLDFYGYEGNVPNDYSDYASSIVWFGLFKIYKDFDSDNNIVIDTYKKYLNSL